MMITPSKNPVVFGGMIVAIVSLFASYGLIKSEDKELWVAILVGAPTAAGFIIQQFTMALHTIQRAGLTPKEIHKKAEAYIPPLEY